MRLQHFTKTPKELSDNKFKNIFHIGIGVIVLYTRIKSILISKKTA